MDIDRAGEMGGMKMRRWSGAVAAVAGTDIPRTQR